MWLTKGTLITRPENILLRSKDEDSDIVLADFGA